MVFQTLSYFASMHNSSLFTWLISAFYYDFPWYNKYQQFTFIRTTSFRCVSPDLPADETFVLAADRDARFLEQR